MRERDGGKGRGVVALALSYAPTSENSVNAKFSIAPAQRPQDRRRGDAHIVGYYALEQRVKPSEGLGHRGGVLRDLIQDPANGLPRITRMRTSRLRRSPK